MDAHGRLIEAAAAVVEGARDLARRAHGIRQAGFFTTVIGESHNELTYLLAWDSTADREQRWNAFATDPAWILVEDIGHEGS